MCRQHFHEINIIAEAFKCKSTDWGTTNDWLAMCIFHETLKNAVKKELAHSCDMLMPDILTYYLVYPWVLFHFHLHPNLSWCYASHKWLSDVGEFLNWRSNLLYWPAQNNLVNLDCCSCHCVSVVCSDIYWRGQRNLLIVSLIPWT